MKLDTFRLRFLLALLGLLAGQMELFGQGTAFTYQGRLSAGGGPANGYYNFSFGLYPTNVSGAPEGGILTNYDVAVTNGLFTTVLDFGPVFDGTAYWLEIGVEAGDSTNDFTILSPRQALSPTPYAEYAANAGTVTGVLTTNNLPPSVALLNGSPDFSGTITAQGFVGNGSGLTNVPANIPAGLVTNYAPVQIVVTNANGEITLSSTNLQIATNNCAFTLGERPLVNAFPVPTLRPLLRNSLLAFDLMPNGGGTGSAWMDICAQDCYSASPPLLQVLHLAANPTYVEVSGSGDIGPALPLYFGDGVYGSINYNLQIYTNQVNIMTNLAAANNVTVGNTVTATNGFLSQITRLNGSYTTTNSDDTILEGASADTTITLMSAVGIAGKSYKIKNTGTGTVTVGTTSAQNIDDSTNASLPTQYDAIQVISDGTQWWIVGEYGPGLSL